MVVLPRIFSSDRSFRITHHRQTSYALLFFLTLGAGVLLAGFSWAAKSQTFENVCGTPVTASCEGTYKVAATVPGPRPTKPVIITSPASGQSFTTNPVTVTGTCPAKSLVKIFTNGVLVGSVICSSSEHFSLPIDLVIGSNELTALAYNALDQAGPTSPAVKVTLVQAVGSFGYSTQLLLQSENFYRGTQPGTEIVWPVTIIAGQGPYAVSVDWGDGSTDLVARDAPGPFTVKHTYQKTGSGYLGSFPLIIRATDAAGQTAYLQLTTIVNSAGAGGSTSSASMVQVTRLWLMWRCWIVLLLMIISFWLGERREKHIMQRQMEALA